MIRGLVITIPAEDLASRIGERIRAHETERLALQERVSRREGDMPYDIRVGDGLETFGELQSRLAFHSARVRQLDLIRTHLIVGETYTLNLADLRGADLIAADAGADEELSTDFVVESPRAALGTSSEARAIQGLTLTMTGAELRERLTDRISSHRECARRWKREEARTPEERQEWRAKVLRFIHDHIESAETYRLGEADLAFGELLPAKPGWLEQDEYEERTAVGFQLERLVKRGV
jgi:hypothetical protein